MRTGQGLLASPTPVPRCAAAAPWRCAFEFEEEWKTIQSGGGGGEEDDPKEEQENLCSLERAGGAQNGGGDILQSGSAGNGGSGRVVCRGRVEGDCNWMLGGPCGHNEEHQLEVIGLA